MNRTKTIKLNIFSTKKISILAAIFVLLSICVYVYSYQLSVSYASSIEVLEDKISNIKSEISEVEFQIVESKRETKKEVAMEAGFVELDEVVFVKKTQKTALNAVTN